LEKRPDLEPTLVRQSKERLKREEVYLRKSGQFPEGRGKGEKTKVKAEHWNCRGWKRESLRVLLRERIGREMRRTMKKKGKQFIRILMRGAHAGAAGGERGESRKWEKKRGMDFLPPSAQEGVMPATNKNKQMDWGGKGKPPKEKDTHLGNFQFRTSRQLRARREKRRKERGGTLLRKASQQKAGKKSVKRVWKRWHRGKTAQRDRNRCQNQTKKRKVV